MRSNIFSESSLYSEGRKEGLKQISSEIKEYLVEKGSCSYKFLCENVSTKNGNTLKRRIYDVLSVMKAINMIEKVGREYRLKSSKVEIDQKKKKLWELKEIYSALKFLIKKNKSVQENDVLYLPFFLVVADTTADVKCETNDERSYFKFESNEELTVVEDIDIVKEISKKEEENVHSFSFIR